MFHGTRRSIPSARRPSASLYGPTYFHLRQLLHLRPTDPTRGLCRLYELRYHLREGYGFYNLPRTQDRDKQVLSKWRYRVTRRRLSIINQYADRHSFLRLYNSCRYTTQFVNVRLLPTREGATLTCKLRSRRASVPTSYELLFRRSSRPQVTNEETNNVHRKTLRAANDRLTRHTRNL